MKFFEILPDKILVFVALLQCPLFLGGVGQKVHAEINGGQDKSAEKKAGGQFVM